MARIKRSVNALKKRRKVMKLAKGYWGAKSKHFKMANQAVMKSLTYAYTGRTGCSFPALCLQGPQAAQA